MSKYIVKWEVDIETDGSGDGNTDDISIAAAKAYQVMENQTFNGGGLPVYEIKDKESGRKWMVDMEETIENYIKEVI